MTMFDLPLEPPDFDLLSEQVQRAYYRRCEAAGVDPSAVMEADDDRPE